MTQTVFVSEYICGGAWPHESLDGSLAVEGRAMLRAIVKDLRRVRDVRVTTTWDHRLLQPSEWSTGRKLDVLTVRSPEQESELFRKLAAQSDSVIVIAPETDNVLAERCRVVESLSGPELCGCSSQAVEHCADKLSLAQRLISAGVETIPTALFDPEHAEAAWPFPLVIKPRFGAGSLLTFRVDTADALLACATEIRESDSTESFIQQPYAPGDAMSCAIIAHRSEGVLDVFPAGRQTLSTDGRFQYLGSVVPESRLSVRQPDIEKLLRRCAAEIPGLHGYVGFDLILPEDTTAPPVVVEINPRLTTGYCAWQALTEDNLASRILSPRADHSGIRWLERGMIFRLDEEGP